MAGDTQISIVGNLSADPELRFTQSGQAVCSLNVGSTPRSFDKASNAWKDGDTLWLRVTAWRTLGENCAESLRKGDRVIVTGRLTQRSYEKDGQKRTSYEIQADAIGPDLLRATARVQKAQRASERATATPEDDPWAAPLPGTDEPPL